MLPTRRRLIQTAAALALPGLAPLRAFAAPAGPPRMVAAGGVITEIVYALDRADWLVGVDSTSLYPAAALKDKKNIGYLRALSTEGILSLEPEGLVAVEGAGPPDVLKLLAEAKVPVQLVPEALDEASVLARIRQVGRVFDAATPADRLADETQRAFSDLAARRAGIGRKTRVLFVLSHQNGRVLVGGRNSAADAMITLAGATNAAAAVEGYKAMSDEGVVTAEPDIILMMQAGMMVPDADALFASPAFRLVPAAKKRALIVMDGLYLLGFGPRAPAAASDLMRRIAEIVAS